MFPLADNSTNGVKVAHPMPACDLFCALIEQSCQLFNSLLWKNSKNFHYFMIQVGISELNWKHGSLQQFHRHKLHIFFIPTLEELLDIFLINKKRKSLTYQQNIRWLQNSPMCKSFTSKIAKATCQKVEFVCNAQVDWKCP